MKYRNKFEAKVAATLDPTFDYEAMKLPYTMSHRYLPDWVDIEAKEIVETKGRFTAADRAKMKAIRAQYPDWSITIVFQDPHRKIEKGSKTTYAAWCDKEGIAWRRG